ncbi:MAG: alpha/beta hydrolase [Polyangiales bacterium]
MQRLTSASFSPGLRAWLDRGRHHNIAGRRVFVVDTAPAGAHPGATPLVLIHGYPSSSFDWHLVLPELARRRRVVLFDLPGFGFSDKPDRYSYSLFEQADVVEGLLERMNLSRPHVVAHDMGVSIASELLARRQRKLLKGDLASLLLMSAGVYEDLAKITASQKVLLTPVGPVFAGLRMGPVFKLQVNRVFTRPVAEELVSAMWEQIVYLDGHKRLPQIASYLHERVRFEERWVGALRVADDIPVHLLWGNSDPFSIVAIGERLAREVPGASLTRLEHVGHYPHLEAPDETLSAITAWLEQLDAHPGNELAAATRH